MLIPSNFTKPTLFSAFSFQIHPLATTLSKGNLAIRLESGWITSHLKVIKRVAENMRKGLEEHKQAHIEQEKRRFHKETNLFHRIVYK
jgi:adenosylmethionine-8-amino-7-oxononanoate aminotransferase